MAYGYRFTNPDYRRNYSKVVDHQQGDREAAQEPQGQRQVPRPETPETNAGGARGDHARRCRAPRHLPKATRIKAEAVTDQLLALATRRTVLLGRPHARALFSNLTSLKRGARKYLRVRGEPLWHVDLPCCHLLALAYQCLQAGVRTAEEFLHYCEGDFYRQLADEGGFTSGRSQGGVHQAGPQRPEPSPLPEVGSDAVLPQAVEVDRRYMWQQKANGKPTKECPKPHNKLALSLQRWEANLVIFRICDRIRRERPECWIATIHDAIACLERDVPFVVEVVEQELKALGITLAPGNSSASRCRITTRRNKP